MRHLPSLILLLSIAACNDKADEDTSVTPGDITDDPIDNDGDGFAQEDDCDDSDASIHPDATEVCDGVDNNCDGDIDEGVTTTWYLDADGDGHGDDGATTQACGMPDGYAANGGDCDDDNDEVHPDAAERCDGVDNDCDGQTDEDVQQTWYADTDGDGWGDDLVTTEDCDPGDGWVSDLGDCDDSRDDVNPDASEVCDAIDNDCDGLIDDDDDSVADPTTWYTDADGDGWGDAASTVDLCAQPSGTVDRADDCDDADAAIHPDAAEVCDEVDNDCDGDVDDLDSDVTDAGTWYSDGDGDGYGDAATAIVSCDQPTDSIDNGDDCDDSDAEVMPGADEYCDGVDNDCDGDTDEDPSSTDAGSLDATTWYSDGDADGYGDASTSTTTCYQPSGTVSDDTDCDDADATTYPGADEYCDSADNDCDGDVDEEAVDAITYYKDDDGDGFGDDDYPYQACSRPSGYAGVKRDCDDTRADVNPWADEVCDDDDTDEDCDGLADDDDSSVDLSTGSTWYVDADDDGYGDATATTMTACDLPDGYSATDDDCDDTTDAVNPSADDICNGIDDDCDGVTDPDALDTDGDGITNCLDPDVYSDDFDSGSWGDWTYVDLGGGTAPSWAMTLGYIYEGSDAANSIAYGPDLGQMWSYSITVDVYSNGGYNNGVGIAFGYEDDQNYWLARWLDPNDHYGYYSPGGEVDIYRCEDGTCASLADDDDSVDLSVPTYQFAEMSVTVDGEDITVWVDGIEALSYTATGDAAIGAFYTGVWTWDNDSGIYYDDFEVTNP